MGRHSRHTLSLTDETARPLAAAERPARWLNSTNSPDNLRGSLPDLWYDGGVREGFDKCHIGIPISRHRPSLTGFIGGNLSAEWLRFRSSTAIQSSSTAQKKKNKSGVEPPLSKVGVGPVGERAGNRLFHLTDARWPTSTKLPRDAKGAKYDDFHEMDKCAGVHGFRLQHRPIDGVFRSLGDR